MKPIPIKIEDIKKQAISCKFCHGVAHFYTGDTSRDYYRCEKCYEFTIREKIK